MTDEALSRWICEKLEPKPEPPNDNEGVWENLMASEGTNNFYDSVGGMWRMRLSGYKHGDLVIWEARDMVNDAQMTLMLLEKLLNIDAVSLLRFNDVLYIELHVGPSDGSDTIKADAKSLGRAVAEAFAKANGLEPVQGETAP